MLPAFISLGRPLLVWCGLMLVAVVWGEARKDEIELLHDQE